jgi:diadenylate cyclase
MQQIGGVDVNRAGNTRTTTRSDAELARIVVRVAEAARVDVIICVTDSEELARRLHNLIERIRVIAGTTNVETHGGFTGAGLETLRLPLRTADKYSQVRHVIAVALATSQVSMGDFVLCVIGCDVYPEEGELIVLTNVEPGIESLVISDLIKLTDAIQVRVMEAAFVAACKIGRAAQRGKRLGAIFMLGDSNKVLEGSKQLVPNPFLGHEKAIRMLTHPDIHNALVELSKLDGAFVVRGDGLVQTAGTFLAPGRTEIDLPAGLGARHAAAAAVTERTNATAVVVSATDGNVRVFSGGKMVLQLDPDVAYGPVKI